MVELPRTSARLSSTYYTYSYQSGSCIDGMYTNMCISGWESEPWLEVDLGSEYHVDMVVVYNRQDCCMRRLGQYEIWVGSLTQAPSALCASTTAPASAGPFSSMCGAIGRYVTVRLPGSYRQLALAELMVYSVQYKPAAPPPSAPSVVKVEATLIFGSLWSAHVATRILDTSSLDTLSSWLSDTGVSVTEIHQAQVTIAQLRPSEAYP